MYKTLFILLFCFSFLEAKIHITVTYPFQKKFIEEIAKDKFIIHIVKEKHRQFKELERRELNKLVYSDAYFTLGLEEEKKFIETFKARNKYIKIIDITKGIKKDIVNGKINPYVWMDPLLVRDLAENIFNESIVLMSYEKESFKKNYEIFLDQLDEIFLDLKRKLDTNQYYNIYVYEPSWHYFAKRFRLNLYYKEKEYPVASKLRDIIKESREHNIKKLLVNEGTPYLLSASLANHINADIIENDITVYNWKINIYSLTRKIMKKKRN